LLSTIVYSTILIGSSFFVLSAATLTWAAIFCDISVSAMAGADSGWLTALDLVEVNPTLDVRNATAILGVELALSALGMKIL